MTEAQEKSKFEAQMIATSKLVERALQLRQELCPDGTEGSFVLGSLSSALVLWSKFIGVDHKDLCEIIEDTYGFIGMRKK